MSDYLPLEIQVDIIKRLPIKSIIRCRSVCKSWKSLIQSSDFIADYSNQVQYILVRYADAANFEQKCVSIVDDDTFPHQKVSVTVPVSVKMLNNSKTAGSSHGLLCLYGDLHEGRDGLVSGTCKAVLWNPSIRKAVDVVVPNVANGHIYGTVLGFGVCGETNDPKIVKITHITSWCNNMERISCIPWQVEVFTLSTRAWRSPYSNLPRKSLQFDCKQQVVVDGFMYWLTRDGIILNGEFKCYYLIVSIDMTSEEFKEVNLPRSLAHQLVNKLSVSNIRESLVMVEEVLEFNSVFFRVWMMENGVQKLFTKLFKVSIPGTSGIFARGFRKNGQPLIETLQKHHGSRSLADYDPDSKSINNVGVIGRDYSFFVYSYMESLLLL